MQIYIWKNNQALGPFDQNQMDAFFKSGQFVPDDLAWCEGMAERKPLSTLFSQASVKHAHDEGSGRAPESATPVGVRPVRLWAWWPQSRIGNIALAGILAFIFCYFLHLTWGMISGLLVLVVYVLAHIVRRVFLMFRFAASDPRRPLTVSSGHRKLGFSSRRWEACFSAAVAASVAGCLGVATLWNLHEPQGGWDASGQDYSIYYGAVNDALSGRTYSNNSNANSGDLLGAFDNVAATRAQINALEKARTSVFWSRIVVCFSIAGIVALAGGLLYYKSLKAFQRGLIASPSTSNMRHARC